MLITSFCGNRQLFEHALTLAAEIAREGREGRKIGTIFVLGDTPEVLRRSRCLILDPLAGHADSVKRISDPDLRETIKELAQLDGAFAVSQVSSFPLGATSPPPRAT